MMANLEIQKNEHREPIDNCRFCWMCRQVCTVATVTHEETLSPRSRAFLLSSVDRNILGYSRDLAEVVYKCCLCGYCESWCQGGWKPPAYIRAARRDLVQNNLVPGKIVQIKDELIKTGNFLGLQRNQIHSKLRKAMDSGGKTADTLLLLGTVARYKTPEIALSVLSLIAKEGQKVSILADEDTSGVDLYDLGFEAEAKKITGELIKKIQSTGCGRLLALDPRDVYFLTVEAKNLGFVLPEVKIVHVLNYISDALKSGKLNPSAKRVCATYHDNGYLARYGDMIATPREILKSMPGLEYREMLWYGKEAHSSGSLLYARLYPEICEKIVRRRFEDVIETGAQVLLTASPDDFATFTEHPARPENLQVVDIAEFFNQRV